MDLLMLWSVLLAVLLPCTFTRDIVTVTDNAPSIEGTNHTLTCEIRKRNSVVKWLNGKDGKPIVYSNMNICDINSADERNFDHSCDPAKNIYNLTILNVTKDDNGKKFVCSNGLNTDCVVLIVGGYEQRLEETDNWIITAISTCSSDKNVTFKWIRIDPVNGEEVDFHPIILNKSGTFCLDECGKSRLMKYTETISLAPSGHGKKQYVKVAVSYGAKRIVSNISHFLYMIEEQASEPKYEDSSVTAVAVIAVVASAVVVVVVVIFCRKQVVRFFNTFFKRAENPINPEEGSESGEERPLNSVDNESDALAAVEQAEASEPIL